MNNENLNAIKKRIKRILIFFLVINLLILTKDVISGSIEKHHKVAKINTNIANSISFLYVLPIKKVFGWNTPLAIPAVALKNIFTDIAKNNIPDDDWGKEYIWYITQFPEYDVTMDQISKKIVPSMFGNKAKREKDFKNYPQKNIEKLYKMSNELYEHLEPIKNKKITDDNLKKLRFNVYRTLAISYMDDSVTLKYLINKKKGIDKRWAHYKDDKIVNRIQKLLDDYIELTEYSKINERDSYTLVMADPDIKLNHDYYIFKLSKFLLRSKLIKDTLTCDDKLIEYYGTSYKNMHDYQFSRRKKPPGVGTQLSWVLGGGTLEGYINLKCQGFNVVNNTVFTLKELKQRESIMNEVINKWRAD